MHKSECIENNLTLSHVEKKILKKNKQNFKNAIAK